MDLAGPAISPVPKPPARHMSRMLCMLCAASSARHIWGISQAPAQQVSNAMNVSCPFSLLKLCFLEQPYNFIPFTMSGIYKSLSEGIYILFTGSRSAPNKT